MNKNMNTMKFEIKYAEDVLAVLVVDPNEELLNINYPNGEDFRIPRFFRGDTFQHFINEVKYRLSDYHKKDTFEDIVTALKQSHGRVHGDKWEIVPIQ